MNQNTSNDTSVKVISSNTEEEILSRLRGVMRERTSIIVSHRVSTVKHADLILVGHDHIYERFAPQSPTQVATAMGVREFVVGTGGSDHGGSFTYVQQPNSQAFNDATYGVLKLTLHSASYDWQFLPEAGKTFTDSGTTNCP